MYTPMAKIAENVLELNRTAEKRITLHKRASTELTVAERGGEMPRKADILVMEIFDSELLGEGVLPTMRHAHQVNSTHTHTHTHTHSLTLFS